MEFHTLVVPSGPRTKATKQRLRWQTKLRSSCSSRTKPHTSSSSSSSRSIWPPLPPSFPAWPSPRSTCGSAAPIGTRSELPRAPGPDHGEEYHLASLFTNSMGDEIQILNVIVHLSPAHLCAMQKGTVFGEIKRFPLILNIVSESIHHHHHQQQHQHDHDHDYEHDHLR